MRASLTLNGLSKEITLILQQQTISQTSRKQLWYYYGRIWLADVCGLISIFMFSLLGKHINKNHIGQYWDDGLAILKYTIGSEAEKLRKKFQKLFK